MNSYLKSWRSSPFAGTIPNDLYYDTQRRTLTDLLQRGAQLKVAYSPESEADILGWILAEEKEGQCVLHYLYVVDSPLKSTVPSTLLNAVPGSKPGIITHAINLKGFKSWKLIPEIARRQAL